MSCRCDQPPGPAELSIPAGLDRIARQIDGFAGFRRAMLAGLASPELAALHAWRARSEQDLGLMLVEFGAYVFDVLSFYDEVIAQECYLRTARLRPSVRKLVELLGYLPRPAVGARVSLAVFAAGRSPLVLPRGTAFRSGAFNGEPPQVFELDLDTRVHPLWNRWRIRPQPAPPAKPEDAHVQVRRGGRIAPNDLVLQTGGNGVRRARRVQDVQPPGGPAGGEDPIVTLLPPDFLPHPVSDAGPLVFSRAVQRAGVAQVNAGSKSVQLDTTYRSIASQSDVIVTAGGQAAAFQVKAATEVDVDLATVQITGGGSFTPKQRVTKLSLSGWPFGSPVASTVSVFFGFSEVAREAAPPSDILAGLKLPQLETPIDVPTDGTSPTRLILEDRDGLALAGTAALDYGLTKPPPRITSLVPDAPFQIMRHPVAVDGNVVEATRGETVAWEVLGSGDASVAHQTFTLAKKPLTYLVPRFGTGLVSTLRVYVNRVQWREVPTLYGQPPDARIYVVRIDDGGRAAVTFGVPLPTGIDNVAASYRFGAGAAVAPAGSITQLARPVPGLQRVRNPVGAAGGADAEPAVQLQRYAPRSALVLGRAVSLADMEALAAAAPGVRGVRAAWDWDPGMQRAAVRIYFIGDPTLKASVLQQVRDATDDTTPIAAVPATAVAATLALTIVTDPAYVESDVLTAVRAALATPVDGLLSPERIGIGLPLYRSRVLAAVEAIAGVVAVTAVTWQGLPFEAFAVVPDAGTWFDLEQGGDLLLNGRGKHG